MNARGVCDTSWMCVPLVPGTKRARGKWAEVTMPLGDLMGERGRCYRPFDIGIRLDLNGMVLIDADTVPGLETEGSRGRLAVTDGPAELGRWQEEHGALPATWMDQSPGRPDGSHLEGLHMLYLQNPEVRVGGHFTICDGVEIKASGILRIAITGTGKKSVPLNDIDVQVLPRECAEKLNSSRRKECVGASGYGGGGRAGEGRNGYLTRVKGQCERDGLTEEQADEAVVQANAALDDPLTQEELAATVLQHKDWGHWKEESTGQRGNLTLSSSREEEGGANCEIDVLTCANDILRKMKAEQDDHPLSLDWKRAPAGCRNFYELLMCYLATAVAVTGEAAIEAGSEWISVRDPDGRFCKWLMSDNHPLLLAQGQKIVALADPRSGEKEEHPGWKKAWGDAKAGDRWTMAEGAALLLPLMLAAAAEGVRASRARFCAMLQEKAHELGKHGISRAMISQWQKYLQGYRMEKASGKRRWTRYADPALAQVHKAVEGESYRRGHRWAYLAPVWGAGAHPDALTLAEMEWAAGFLSIREECDGTHSGAH